MKRIRITLVSEYFWPEEAGSGRFLGEMMTELGSELAGAEIQVLTSDRVYRTSDTATPPRKETRNRTLVRRLPSLRRGNDGFLRRLLADVVFSIWAAVRTALDAPDCVIATTNPPLTPIALRLVARFRGRPFIYIIHDLFPDVPVALSLWSRDNPVVRLLASAQRSTLRHSAAVIVLGQCMKAHVAKTYGVDPEQISEIPHWATIPTTTREAITEAASPNDPFRVLYAGNLGRFQDFETLLDAAERLRREREILFEIVGHGARCAQIQGEVACRSLDNVRFRSFVPEDEFEDLLLRTNLGLVTLEPGLEALGVPSKTYNLLAAGVPIAAVMGPKSEVALLIEEHGCGFRVDQGDSESLAHAIRNLARGEEERNEMKRAALAAARAQPGAHDGALRLASLIRRAVS